MRNSQGRGAPNEFATAAEVMAAIESLPAEEDYRLKRFARYRIRGLGRPAMGRTYVSLLDEAIASTLQGCERGPGGRKWPKNRVSFVNHLYGAMRSISTHWKEAYERKQMDAERFEWELRRKDEQDDVAQPRKQASDPAADPFRCYAARELLEILDKRFAEDEDALLVMIERQEGRTVSEIVAEFGLTEKRVNAAMQRIRYFMEGLP